MQHFVNIQKRNNSDVGFIGDNIRPLNNKGCIGKHGIDKNYSLDKLIELAYEVDANIIIKSGPNAKWYLKKVRLNEIDKEIYKQSWRDVSRTTMWIIEWKNNNKLEKGEEYIINERDYSDCPEWLLNAEIILNNTI